MISHVLQQRPFHPHPPRSLCLRRELVLGQRRKKFPNRAPSKYHRCHGLFRPFLGFHLLYVSLVCPRHILDHLLNGWSSE